MTATSAVKDELSQVAVVKPCCRRAEVSTLLRFTSVLYRAAGQVVLEAELDSRATAVRLQAGIAQMFGYPAELRVRAPAGRGKGRRHLVRVSNGQTASMLAHEAGLIDRSGRPVRGLPTQVVSGASCDCAAVWRGAFLAHGSLTETGWSTKLQITCPRPETALAIVGAARRMSVRARVHDGRGVDQVVIRDGEAIAAMLTRLGAHEAVQALENRRARSRRDSGNPESSLTDANLLRSARAAETTAVRVGRALQILGNDVPRPLAAAGRLRLEHRQACLPVLGQLADPPLTKDAIAGRIRRLLALADRRAAEQGTPGTEAALVPDMLP